MSDTYTADTRGDDDVPTADDVASVIISRSGSSLDQMSLQKLLYYVQAWHVAITDEPLFNEQIKAWKNGPVVPQVWHARKDPAKRRAVNQGAVERVVSPYVSDLIDLVLGSYGSMSAEELSALTHVETPWQEARGDLPEDANGYDPISTQSMAKFYRASRHLDGRTAADLAAGGMHRRTPAGRGPVDVDAILASLGEEFADPGDNPWGSANLDDGTQYDSEGIDAAPGRARSGA